MTDATKPDTADPMPPGPTGMAWPPGWELVTRDGRRFCTCDGGCFRIGDYVPGKVPGDTVPLPDPADVIVARGGGCDYSKPDGGLTPEWVLQQDIQRLKKSVERYCDHLEAFEAAAAGRANKGTGDERT
jgi:hypothetical protein